MVAESLIKSTLFLWIGWEPESWDNVAWRVNRELATLLAILIFERRVVVKDFIALPNISQCLLED